MSGRRTIACHAALPTLPQALSCPGRQPAACGLRPAICGTNRPGARLVGARPAVKNPMITAWRRFAWLSADPEIGRTLAPLDCTRSERRIGWSGTTADDRHAGMQGVPRTYVYTWTIPSIHSTGHDKLDRTNATVRWKSLIRSQLLPNRGKTVKNEF